MKVYKIDGLKFSNLDEFFNEISEVLIPGCDWGRNMDAFEDILYGGFGTPDKGFTLVWKNAAVSRQRLGVEETVRVLRKRLETCHPTNRRLVQKDLRQALARKGPTVFDWLVEIIRKHEVIGDDAGRRIRLELR